MQSKMQFVQYKFVVSSLLFFHLYIHIIHVHYALKVKDFHYYKNERNLTSCNFHKYNYKMGQKIFCSIKFTILDISLNILLIYILYQINMN